MCSLTVDLTDIICPNVLIWSIQLENIQANVYTGSSSLYRLEHNCVRTSCMTHCRIKNINKWWRTNLENHIIFYYSLKMFENFVFKLFKSFPHSQCFSQEARATIQYTYLLRLSDCNPLLAKMLNYSTDFNETWLPCSIQFGCCTVAVFNDGPYSARELYIMSLWIVPSHVTDLYDFVPRTSPVQSTFTGLILVKLARHDHLLPYFFYKTLHP